MTSSSEIILLQVPQVTYQQSIGTLYLMDQRMVWKAENEDTDDASISHLYCDIKSQQIIYPNKERLAFKIVLRSNKFYIFRFNNSGGFKNQTNDLHRVKRTLFKLLRKGQQEFDKTLNDKCKFLASQPDRLQRYKDLVGSDIITSQEFWTNQATKYDWLEEIPPQEIGISSGFMSEIKQFDAPGGSTYNLTPDTINSIFKVYPSIKQLYKKVVPATLTKKDFWIKFANSHYFQENEKCSTSNDIFIECSKIDDEEMKQILSNGVKNPSFDIASFVDKSQYEGYGLQSEYSNSNSTTYSRTLISRINRQSIMVCKKSIDQTEASGSGKSTNEDELLHIGKKQKFSHDENNLKTTLPLNLTKVERYLHGPKPKIVEDTQQIDVVLAETEMLLEDRYPCFSSIPLIIPEASGELTQNSCRQKVPKHVKQAVKNLYEILCELLNQFWKCFPPTTPELQEKAFGMHAALTRFQSIKLQPFEDELKKESSLSGHNLTKHLHRLIETANRKFDDWQKYSRT